MNKHRNYSVMGIEPSARESLKERHKAQLRQMVSEYKPNALLLTDGFTEVVKLLREIHEEKDESI